METAGVTESAVRHIREEIILGQLPAGARLRETELAGRLGISNPPLREAFRILASEHLVVCTPRKGSSVAPISAEDCVHLFQARQMLECGAIDILSQERATSLAPLSDALKTAQVPPETKSTLEHFHDMNRFHLRLIEIAGNDWLTRFHQGLQSSLARYQVMYLNLPGSSLPALQEHARILFLLENAQYEGAKQHMTAHLDRTRQCLVVNMRGGSLEHDPPQAFCG